MFPCLLSSSAVTLPFYFACLFQSHPFSFIFPFVLWEQLFTSVQDSVQVLTVGCFQSVINVKTRHKWEKTVPFSCYHLHCLRKSQKDIKAQDIKWCKTTNPRGEQVCLPLWEGDERWVWSVYFDSHWCLFCIFVIIILATSFLELHLVCWLL